MSDDSFGPESSVRDKKPAFPSLFRPGLILAALGLVLLVIMAGRTATLEAQVSGARLVNAHSGLCLEIYGFSTANFAAANQWDCHGGSNQSITVTPTGDGFYELRVAVSNKCLEVMNWSWEDGAPVGQWTCHGGDNQKWAGQFVNGATFTIYNRFSGKCLEIYGWSGANGAEAVQWSCHGGNNQRWRLDVPGAPAQATNFRVVGQTCLSDGRVSVSFAWTTSALGTQWLDASWFNNGFIWGTFEGHGPLPAVASSYVWNGAQHATRHYARVNTGASTGWRPSATISFDTINCATGAPAQVVSKLPTTQRVVSLTFDGGSDAGYTSMILDTLQRNGIRAAFGITGQWAERYPDLIRRIAAEGHELINHSYDHKSMTGFSTGAGPLSRADRWNQLNWTEDIVWNLTGRSTKPYFRPPYGDYDASVNADVGAIGYKYNVMWTVDSYGWRGWSATDIANRVVSLAEPGAIIIFHVGSASQDGPALQNIIDRLWQLGYGFTSLDAHIR